VKLVVILMLCAMVATCVMQGNSTQDPAPAPAPTRSDAANSTLTPMQALIMQECAKAVLAGEERLKQHHFAQIDDCAERMRVALLAKLGR
jgi:hypothetical protein